MGFTHGSKAKVYCNGYNTSTFLREFQAAYTVDSAETSTFGNTFKTYTPGMKDGTLTAGGIFDGGIDAVDEIFTAMIDTVLDDIITYMPQGDVLGLRAQGFASLSTGYQVSSSISDVTAVQLQGQNNVGAESGIILHPLAAEAAPGDGSGVDMVTVSTTNGWSAYLQVVSGTDLVVKVQDSANGSTWADLTGALFSEFDARGAQRIIGSDTATVRRYARASWTGTGTFQTIFIRK